MGVVIWNGDLPSSTEVGGVPIVVDSGAAATDDDNLVVLVDARNAARRCRRIGCCFLVAWTAEPPSAAACLAPRCTVGAGMYAFTTDVARKQSAAITDILMLSR